MINYWIVRGGPRAGIYFPSKEAMDEFVEELKKKSIEETRRDGSILTEGSLGIFGGLPLRVATEEEQGHFNSISQSYSEVRHPLSGERLWTCPHCEVKEVLQNHFLANEGKVRTILADANPDLPTEDHHVQWAMLMLHSGALGEVLADMILALDPISKARVLVAFAGRLEEKADVSMTVLISADLGDVPPPRKEMN